MYEFKVDIDNKEYNKFIENYSCAPITQDYRWASVKKDWDSTLCALYKDNKIVGASLLLIKTFPNAITKTAAAIASGIPEATTVPIINPNTAVTATSFAAAYWLANKK